jgi:hypothetical protein
MPASIDKSGGSINWRREICAANGRWRRAAKQGESGECETEAGFLEAGAGGARENAGRITRARRGGSQFKTLHNEDAFPFRALNFFLAGAMHDH